MFLWLQSSRQPPCSEAEIEEAEGALRYRQELFMLVEGAEDGSEEPLSDDFEIEAACTVALCVKPEEEWEWDAASDLIKDKVFELKNHIQHPKPSKIFILVIGIPTHSTKHILDQLRGV